MAKLTLNTIAAGYSSTTALNANSAATEAAMEKTLSRDGTSPNTMTADLDMNGNNILNSANALGAVTSVTGTAPIVVTSGVTPAVSITASTTSVAGSMSAVDKTKLDTLGNLTGHVTSVGTAAVLGSFTSAQLATALSDETGSGAAVFGTSPSMASPTMTGTVTVPTPSNATDAATKAYVDTIKQGSIDIKDSVRVASTANIAIASALTNGSTIDGVTVATGNRVLLKDQSDASENGIYAVVASGAASRTVDANTDTLVTSGMYTYVAEGTAGNSIGFVLTTADPITLDTTNLTFTQFSSAGAIAAGTGMTKTSNTLDVIGTSGRIVANVNSIDIGTLVGTRTSATGSAEIPVGTTAQRDGSPATGYLRYNSTETSFEGYNGSSWGSIGGGASGSGGDTVFQENSLIVTTNYTLTTAKNASSVGPITINSGITVTVPSGARWVII